MHILANILAPVLDFLLKVGSYIWAYKAGRDREKLKQAERKLKDAKKAKTVSESVGAMSPLDVKRQLRDYARDE